MALVNLSDLYNSLSAEVRGLNIVECSLSSAGQDYVRRRAALEGYHDVIFGDRTTTFVHNNGIIQYCPNQYFRCIVYGFEYSQALRSYKVYSDLIDGILKERRGMSGSTSVLKDYKTRSRLNPDRLLLELSDEVSELIDEKLSEDGCSVEEIRYFKRFVTDYHWWAGEKTINRKDFFHSPLLSLLNVVNVDNGFYTKLIDLFDLNVPVEDLKETLGISTISEESTEPDQMRTELVIGKNLIVYGAPGTGKSHKIGQLSSGHVVMTTTFHSEYSYSDFIGSFRPFPLYQRQVGSDDDSVGENNYFDVSGNEFTRGRPFIDYRFVPGDFLKILRDALHSENVGDNRHYVLVIEELNRGNAAAIFGDFFQLLDRDRNGKSKYAIMNGDVVNYLKETLGAGFQREDVYIPGNLSLFATMNSADQGVFPLDTAFKRRWNYEYLRINYEAIENGTTEIPYNGGSVFFKEFMETINENLSSRLHVHEDKLLGSYFISPEELRKADEETDSEFKDRLKDLVSNKILMYLWDDVARYQRASIFKHAVTFGDVINQYQEGNEIFTFEFPIEFHPTETVVSDEDEDEDV